MATLLQQTNKQEGDSSQAIVTFFAVTKSQKEGLKRGRLLSSSRSRSRLGLGLGAS